MAAELAADVLVLGGGGQLGRELACVAVSLGRSVEILPRAALDITDRAALERLLRDYPTAGTVINAAAYTAVDRAEADREAAWGVNATGAANVAGACAEAGKLLLHVSTDYVFDGEAGRPWREDDPIAPLNVYGASKAAGEAAVRAICPRHVILRTSWVFGAHGANFVKTMLRLARERDSVAVVNDQVGRPTWTGSLGRVLLEIARRASCEEPRLLGTFHYADRGPTTWCEFARTIFARAAARGSKVPAVEPIATAEYPTAARRPRYSVLATDKIEAAYGISPAPWEEGLDLCLDRLLEGDAEA